MAGPLTLQAVFFNQPEAAQPRVRRLRKVAVVPPPTKPGPHAGDMSPLTRALRGPLPLTTDQRTRARFLRFKAHWDWPDIAADLDRSEQDVRHALANARTSRKDPPRGTMNVSIAAYDWFRGQQRPGEPMWQTVNRIVGI